MKFSLVSLALAATAIAAPTATESVQERDVEERNLTPISLFHPTPIQGCLNAGQAINIIIWFQWLLNNPKDFNFAATANALFSDDWQDISDSINQLAGIPEGQVTFANKAAFIASSSQQPPLLLLSLDQFWSCNAINWRWISLLGTGNNQEKVKGINNFYINPQGQIQRTYAEFNSGAWLADLGYPECKAS